MLNPKRSPSQYHSLLNNVKMSSTVERCVSRETDKGVLLDKRERGGGEVIKPGGAHESSAPQNTVWII